MSHVALVDMCSLALSLITSIIVSRLIKLHCPLGINCILFVFPLNVTANILILVKNIIKLIIANPGVSDIRLYVHNKTGVTMNVKV